MIRFINKKAKHFGGTWEYNKKQGNDEEISGRVAE
jgi:hypothetical protein